jgi:predicted PurR-regulated permease PerM
MGTPEPERDRFAHIIFYGVIALTAWLTYLVVRPFLQPLGWAAIFAIMLYPLYIWLSKRLRPNRAALATTIFAAVVMIGPVTTLLSLLAGQATEAATAFRQTDWAAATPERLLELWQTVRQRSPLALPEDPAALVSQGVQRFAAFLAPRAGAVLQNVAQTLFGMAVMLFSLFFFLRDGASYGSRVKGLLPFSEARRDRLVRDTRNLVVASLGSGLAVAAVQGFIGGVAFWLLGIDSPLLWGVVMAFCSLVPVVGAAIVWLPVAVWLLLSGDVVRGVILVAVGVGGIGMADNILRPLLLSGRSSGSGLVVFLGLLGGVAAFGFVGLILGPIVLMVAGTLVDAFANPEAR